MMRIALGFPDVEAEKNILLSNNEGPTNTTNNSRQAITTQELISMQKHIQQIHVANDVIDYIIALCRVTRAPFSFGDKSEITCKPLSPRAGKSLLAAAKAWAFINNRDFVLPDDVQAVFSAVCQHRIELSAQEYNGSQNPLSEQIIQCVDVLNPLKQ